MAKKTTTPPPQGPTISPEQGIAFLQKDITRGEEIAAEVILTDEKYNSWKHLAEQHLKQAFGQEDDTVMHFKRTGAPVMIMNIYDRETEHDRSQTRKEWTRKKVAVLKTAVQLLEERVAPFEATANSRPDRPGPSQATSNNVFIVHGHDEAVKQATARVLERLGLSATILHEQANQSRTIIEKFEDHSHEANYAVVLLTGDDLGRKRGEGEVEHPRARQNVILELGYFLGKLGRKRVCALVASGVETPSDVDGVLYIPIDPQGAWHFLLGKELRAAGFQVSLDNL